MVQSVRDEIATILEPLKHQDGPMASVHLTADSETEIVCTKVKYPSDSLLWRFSFEYDSGLGGWVCRMSNSVSSGTVPRTAFLRELKCHLNLVDVANQATALVSRWLPRPRNHPPYGQVSWFLSETDEFYQNQGYCRVNCDTDIYRDRFVFRIEHNGRANNNYKIYTAQWLDKKEIMKFESDNSGDDSEVVSETEWLKSIKKELQHYKPKVQRDLSPRRDAYYNTKRESFRAILYPEKSPN